MTDIAETVVNAYSARSTNSARSRQAADRILGPSDLGGCREYLRRFLTGEEMGERRRPPIEAFIGTAIGDALERAYVAANSRVRSQVRLEGTLPSGRHTGGTADLVFPDGVGDFKTKNGLAQIRLDGPSFKNLVQVNTYLYLAIQRGIVPEGSKWRLIYFDRSGVEPTPHVVEGELDLDLITEVELRLDDVEYGAVWGEECPKDEPVTWCLDWCPFASTCRANYQPSGLVDDPAHVAAVDRYLEGQRMAKEGEALKKSAKRDLQGVEGSTGSATVRWMHVSESVVPETKRAAYSRLDVRQVR